MYELVIVRHGESQWNLENRFTGWVDVDLSEKGIAEAKKGGKSLKDLGFNFDLAYTSVLKRAIKTLFYIQDEMDLLWIPVIKDWRLNERHYGDLQGLNKSETAAKFGEDQVKIWRRSYSTPPPALGQDNEMYPGKDPKYANLSNEQLPLTECLKDTVDRVLPLWNNELTEIIKSGKKLLIVAHGNSLRALIKHLDKMTEDEILNFNMPTGIPMLYKLDENLNPISKEFIGDAEEVKKAMEAVANQGKAK